MQARRGERAAYRPLSSPLAASSAPRDVVAGLLGLAAFPILYVADLDAIAGGRGHHAQIGALRAAFPHLGLWVDAGEHRVEEVEARARAGLGTPVIGTESLSDEAEARAVLSDGRVILSLDHDRNGPMGPPAVHVHAALWPARVIAMTLARVGSGEGPDLETLARIRALRPGGELYAAGGVRGPADLAQLAEMGVAGVLVASALHDGRIDAATARRYAQGARQGTSEGASQGAS